MAFVCVRVLFCAMTVGFAHGLTQNPKSVFEGSAKRDVQAAWRNGHRSKALPQHYHTSADIHTKLVDLVKSCDGVELKTVEESVRGRGLVVLEYLHFKPKGGAKPKLMMFANEHAREMVTAEAALGFVEDMCKNEGRAAKARNLLETLVVVNANPYSRSLAENGEFCRRSNPNHVDINRNWDDKFGEGSHLDQTNTGSSPFSEPETRLLKRIVEKFKPSAYFSVHSGFKGILFSNRFSKHTADLDIANSIFTGLNQKFCNCPQGPADTTLSYHAAGTSLDYVADKSPGTKLSVAFEMWPDKTYNAHASIYEDNGIPRSSSFLERSETSSSTRGSSAAGMTEEEIEGMDPAWCLRAFNPVTKKDFNATVNNFKNIFSEVALSLGQNGEQWQKLSASI